MALGSIEDTGIKYAGVAASMPISKYAGDLYADVAKRAASTNLVGDLQNELYTARGAYNRTMGKWLAAGKPINELVDLGWATMRGVFPELGPEFPGPRQQEGFWSFSVYSNSPVQFVWPDGGPFNPTGQLYVSGIKDSVAATKYFMVTTMIFEKIEEDLAKGTIDTRTTPGAGPESKIVRTIAFAAGAALALGFVGWFILRRK